MAAIGRASIVEREDNPAMLDEILLDRAAPGVGRLPPRPRAAIDLEEDRIASAGLTRRRKHPVMQLGAVRRLDRTEARLDVGGEIGRVRMRRVEPVLLDPGDPLALSVGEIDL